MAVKTTLKKTITKKTADVAETQTALQTEKSAVSARSEADSKSGVIVAKKCFFCETNKEPTYTDGAALRKFMSERARILPKQRTGACSKHQRKISASIKYARHLSLLPFVNKL